jgi:nucleoid DNA-binding protein
MQDNNRNTDVSSHAFVLGRLTEDIQKNIVCTKGMARKLAKRLIHTFAESVFEAVVMNGEYKFSNGFGMFRLKHVKGATYTLPTSKKVVVSKDRKKVVYSEGKTTKAMTDQIKPNNEGN